MDNYNYEGIFTQTDTPQSVLLQNGHAGNSFYTYIEMPGSMLREEELQYISGKALKRVQGIIGLKSGIRDVFKDDRDLTRGIEIGKGKNGGLHIKAHIITDMEYNQAKISITAKAAIASDLENIAGIQPESIEIEITDAMTRMEFNDRFGYERAIN